VAENGNTKNFLQKAAFVLIALLVVYNIYTGATIQESKK